MSNKTVNDFLSEANAEIISISAEEAKKNSNDILFIDVRDKHERDAEPVIEDAVQLSRGMLEFYADKEGPYFNKVLNTEKKIVLFSCCESDISEYEKYVFQLFDELL